MTESTPEPARKQEPSKPSIHGKVERRGLAGCSRELVPQDKALRERIRSGVRDYVSRQKLVPPLSMEDLRRHTDILLSQMALPLKHRDFVTVLVGNEVWWDTMAGIPYERRVLLLPQCLRNKQNCPAEMDEMGLLCEQCGQCSIGRLQTEAEELGYVVLVAEGTTVVTRLLEQGRVDAVIGVSCLSVLERAFPQMATHAIPGLAIPLLRDGCDLTEVDLDWVRQALYLKSDQPWAGRLDIDWLRLEMDSWFQPEPLRQLIGYEHTRTEDLAISWLARSGKRWRPLLGVCAYKVLSNSILQPVPGGMKKVAVAMECFHKASLVHDDIEDADDFRYGEPTLHRQAGVPVALNVGDFLLGVGYRLLSESGASESQISRMLAVAAEGHCTLCMGQGEELGWMREPTALTSRQVLDLFRRKTAPAFEVALHLGAIYAGADGNTSRVLKAFSESLGVAYQIKDDLEDFHGRGQDQDARRPSLLFALAWEASSGEIQAAIERQWCHLPDRQHDPAPLPALVEELKVEEKARQLLEHYRNEAIRSLSLLQNAQLKGLLRRLVGRILGT
ncbi:MAG TPA: polyprenyl synthetase family protein [Candidatus Paceibacterota bacterium]|nr:polyprenyl synthetase family protein [Verrucomicrobiota bacterium]HRY46757.1 polyprenyl synthetase family protein [Candidatus Paceibacterota bacterium]HSA01110.1 polyprenyl synthetase family protein [Candidatus Paceibacterota bacterium]